MAVYRWYCSNENYWCNKWEDSVSCQSRSKYWYRDLDKVKKAARKHENKTGHQTVVQSIDGRRVKGQIR